MCEGAVLEMDPSVPAIPTSTHLIYPQTFQSLQMRLQTLWRMEELFPLCFFEFRVHRIHELNEKAVVHHKVWCGLLLSNRQLEQVLSIKHLLCTNILHVGRFIAMRNLRLREAKNLLQITALGEMVAH